LLLVMRVLLAALVRLSVPSVQSAWGMASLKLMQTSASAVVPALVYVLSAPFQKADSSESARLSDAIF
jgi:hypothetical protein